MRIVFVDFDGVLNSNEYFALHPVIQTMSPEERADIRRLFVTTPEAAAAVD